MTEVSPLPAWRRLYEQIKSLDLGGPLERRVEELGAKILHAEFLAHVYSGPAFPIVPTPLAQALAEVDRCVRAIRTDVQRLRPKPPAAAKSVHKPEPAPAAPAAKAPAAAIAPTVSAPPMQVAAAPPVVVPVAKAGSTVVVPAGAANLQRVGSWKRGR